MQSIAQFSRLFWEALVWSFWPSLKLGTALGSGVWLVLGIYLSRKFAKESGWFEVTVSNSAFEPALIALGAFVFLFVVRLLAAPYVLWRRERANARAVDGSGHETVRKLLLEFYSEVGEMLDNLAPLNKPEDKEAVIKMADDTIQPRINYMGAWILSEMGTGASAKFSERSRQQHVIYGKVEQPRYDMIRNLEQIRENLNTLISDPSWHQRQNERLQG
jgi:hypothetical protein